MSTANRRRSCSPPANRQRSRSPPPAASSPYFPPELIPEVASRLTSLQDFFALRASCRAYRDLLPLTPSNLASQSPLLLVSLDSDYTESHALFHPTLRRIHRFRLPRTPVAGNECVTTHFYPLGCRLAIYEIRDPSCPRNFSIVHLLTGERACVSSPPKCLSRVLLAGDLVLTWNCMDRDIQYCHLETADWRVAAITQPYSLEDLIYVKGTLYALVSPGHRLAVVELSETNNSVELVFLGGCWDAQLDDTGSLHLAQCCGDLILIELVEFHPRVYHLFRWKFGEAKWERITSLGGCTLFLSDRHFVGCLGPDHRGFRGESIYVKESFDGGWYEYSLGDGSFDKFDAEYPEDVPSDLSSRVWIFPSMC